MRTIRNQRVVATLCSVAALLSSCDSHEYKGMDGATALRKANSMGLVESYKFYLETYKGTSPPLIQVAETFKRFGPEGAEFIERRISVSTDRQEFEAGLVALTILDAGCGPSVLPVIKVKAAKFGLDKRYVRAACRSDD